MEKRIKVTGYEITPDVSKYLDTRLKAIEKLVGDDEAARCEVELGQSAKHSRKSDTQWFAEMNLKAGKRSWRAVETAATVKAAIDMVKDELVLQVKRAKDFKKTAVRRGGQEIKKRMRG